MQILLVIDEILNAEMLYCKSSNIIYYICLYIWVLRYASALNAVFLVEFYNQATSQVGIYKSFSCLC